MQKIVIENFGPIYKVDIEIKPITVLLGEQSTGKSTVAQCVHLFLSLGEDLRLEFLKANKGWDIPKIKEVALNTVRGKFYAYYGSSRFLGNFDVKFYYNERRYIWIRPESISEDNPTTQASFENFDLDKFCNEVFNFCNTRYRSIEDKEDRLEKIIDDFLWEQKNPFVRPTYFIAGRNITVGFSESFKTFFLQNYQRTTRLNTRNAPKSAQMELTSNFIEHSAYLRDDMHRYGGNFEELLREANIGKSFNADFEKRVTSILKGKYIIARDGSEVIKIERGRHIPLGQASSGQQESIRILQDLAVQCAYNECAFRTIEEPEAHLFPSAQNALTELLVMTHNQTGSYFFLTTHSPYFLSAFNNLLYAAKAAGDNLPDTARIREHVLQVERLGYPIYLRLLSKKFSAYQLRLGKPAESIFDPEKAITDIDSLDAVSIEISQKFESLVEIVKESEEYEAA